MYFTYNSALYSTLNAIVTSYNSRLQQWICKSLMFPWFYSIITKAVATQLDRRDVTCRRKT